MHAIDFHAHSLTEPKKLLMGGWSGNCTVEWSRERCDGWWSTARGVKCTCPCHEDHTLPEGLL